MLDMLLFEMNLLDMWNDYINYVTVLDMLL